MESVKLKEADGVLDEQSLARPKQKNRNSVLAYYVIVLIHVTVYVQLGMLVTSLNPATPALKRFFNHSYVVRFSEPASDASLTLLVTLTMSMVLVGAILGSMATPIFVLLMTRRAALIWYHVGTLISLVLMSPVTYFCHSYEAIIVGRFVSGFARGFGMNIATLMVTELSCVENLAVCQSPPGWLLPLGFVIGTITGHPKILGSDTMWPVLVALPAVFSIFYLTNVCVIPPSPFVLLRSNKRSEAYRSLRKLRGSPKAVVSYEFAHLEKQIRDGPQSTNAPFGELLTNPTYRRQLLTACLILINIQTVGFINIMLYSDSIFIAAGVSPEYATYPSIGVCAEAVLLAFAGTFILGRLDMRRLLISGNMIIALSCVVLTITSALKDLSPAMPYANVFATIVYMLGVGIGPMLVSFPLMVESISKYPEAKAPILIVAGTVFWIAASGIGFSAPYLFKLFGPYAWLFYTAMTSATTLYFVMFLKTS